MTDNVALEGASAESVEPAEKAAVEEAVANSATARAALPDGMVRLYEPEHGGLEFGDRHIDGEDGLIRFGARGFQEPGFWIGPADHPLLDQLLAKHPHIRSVDAPNKVYVCDECGAEFRVVIALRGHRRIKHKNG